jgi:uncharacterized integral membrane protein
MTFLKLWFLATAAVVASFAIWVYMPVVIPFLAIAAILGAITAMIVALAEFARERMNPRGDDPDA